MIFMVNKSAQVPRLEQFGYSMSIKSPTIHPLYFEGVRLPDFGAFLDIAATVTPVSEETHMWFWRFAICIGSPRKERSKVIASAASGLAPELLSKFPGYHPEQVITDWVKSLRMIIEMSQSRKTCQWQMEETHQVLQSEIPAWTVLASPSSAVA
jgi:hypothetical protein